jgi:hypothetical protein
MGNTGLGRRMAGHDINYMALGGALEGNGACGGPPAIPGIQIADLAGGAMQAVTGVLLALAARAKTGRGQAVDVSMVDGVACLLPVALGLHAATGELPARGDGVLTGRYACYRVYEAADGRSIAVGALEPKFWDVALPRTGMRAVHCRPVRRRSAARGDCCGVGAHLPHAHCGRMVRAPAVGGRLRDTRKERGGGSRAVRTGPRRFGGRTEAQRHARATGRFAATAGGAHARSIEGKEVPRGARFSVPCRLQPTQASFARQTAN